MSTQAMDPIARLAMTVCDGNYFNPALCDSVNDEIRESIQEKAARAKKIRGPALRRVLDCRV
jgi:TPP-dependent pyruvate/acetoin dehydrogenase alpha subunit